MPVEISVTMNESCGNREVLGLIYGDIDDKGNMIPECNRHFKRIWPLFLCPFQKVGDYGATMIPVPYYKIVSSKNMVSFIIDAHNRTTLENNMENEYQSQPVAWTHVSIPDKNLTSLLKLS